MLYYDNAARESAINTITTIMEKINTIPGDQFSFAEASQTCHFLSMLRDEIEKEKIKEEKKASKPTTEEKTAAKAAKEKEKRAKLLIKLFKDAGEKTVYQRACIQTNAEGKEYQAYTNGYVAVQLTEKLDIPTWDLNEGISKKYFHVQQNIDRWSNARKYNELYISSIMEKVKAAVKAHRESEKDKPQSKKTKPIIRFNLNSGKSLGMNPDYFLTVLSLMGDDTTIYVDHNDHKAPVIMENTKGDRAAIMPINLNQDDIEAGKSKAILIS